ncbi:endogenous retrovirus group K member 113 Gag polyprotein-like [Dasypus novemcinctus]|uniref:endogenous retrovirus group K member 113 Gag polyprotein-like n=1 Tax=Dasypus novemcinctus TaxID=9361 RepID=UPI0039C9CE8B
MGNQPGCLEEYSQVLKTLLHSVGATVKTADLLELFVLVQKHCYWFQPQGKNLMNVKQWRQVIKELRRAYQKGENIAVSVWALGQHIAAALDPLQSDEEEEIVLFSREEMAMNDTGKDRNLEEDQEEEELFEVRDTNPFLTKSMSELNISKANIYPNLTHEVPSAPPEPGKVPSGLFSMDMPYVHSSFKPNPVPVTPLMRCLLSGSSQENGEEIWLPAKRIKPRTEEVESSTHVDPTESASSFDLRAGSIGAQTQGPENEGSSEERQQTVWPDQV